jgi:hypothetical protein
MQSSYGEASHVYVEVGISGLAVYKVGESF